MSYTFTLTGEWAKERAKRIIDAAPVGYVFTVAEAKRSDQQNALLWAVLTDVAVAKPLGRCHTPEVWKCLFMNALGHTTLFEQGLDGRPFPVGFRSSRLTKSQMSDLMEFIFCWCAENGVQISGERKHG